MTTAGLSDALCRHIAGFPAAEVPGGALDAAARALMDATGVMLAASGLSPDVAPFIDLAAAQGGGPCSILGTGISTSASMAAFANGAMAHALDFEDAFDPAPSHPNASLMPAAIALVQAADGPVSGRDFLTALAVGCDVVCRLGLSLRQTMEESGWYPPPILGAFGAAAAGARIAGLNARQTRDALSLALCQVTAPGEIKHSAGTVVRAVREAFPAQAAVTAVQLARAGVAGFEEPLEGPGGFFRLYVDGRYAPEALLAGLGRTWLGEQLTFKAWPACRGTHAFIEIALALRASPGFDWRQITAVRATIGEVQRMLTEPLERKRAPATAIDAKFSIPFTIALALVRGRVGLDDFDAAALSDPDVLALAARVEIVERPDWGRDRAAAGALSLTLGTGEVLNDERLTALGAPANPLGAAALEAKFADCAARARSPLSGAEAGALAQTLLGLAGSPDAAAAFAVQK